MLVSSFVKTSKHTVVTVACCASLKTHTPTQDEVVAYVRRRSNAFSRGKSRFRGVSGQDGRWESRIGRFCGRKNVRCWGCLRLNTRELIFMDAMYLLCTTTSKVHPSIRMHTCAYLCIPTNTTPFPQVSFGVHDTEEGAARQYDRGMIIEKGAAAKTNFPLRDYIAEVRRYEAFLDTRSGTAVDDVRRRYTLPLHAKHPFEAEAGTEAGKPSRSARAAVVLAEALRVALGNQH